MTSIRCVEAVNNMIIRRVRVDRVASPMGAIGVEGFTQYLDKDVVDAMPHGEGEEVEVHFLNFGRYVSVNELEQEVEKMGFHLADPYSLAAVVREDSALADTYPLATQWRNKEGQTCFAIFDRWDGDREMEVGWDDRVWGDDYWFACLCK